MGVRVYIYIYNISTTEVDYLTEFFSLCFSPVTLIDIVFGEES